MLKQRLLKQYSALPLHWKMSLPLTITFFWLWLLGTSALGYYLSQQLEKQKIKQTEAVAALVFQDIEEELEELRHDARLVTNQDLIEQGIEQQNSIALLQHLLPLGPVLQVDLIMVVDKNQQVLLDSRQNELQGIHFKLQTTIQQVLAGGDLSTIVTANNAQPVLMVGTAPIKNTAGIQGGLIFGKAINTQLLQQIRDRIDEELIVIQGEQIFASTLPRDLLIDVAELTKTHDPVVSIGPKRYISQTVALKGIDGEIRLILLSDRTALEQTQMMRWLGIGIVAVLGGSIAVLMGYWVGNSITRPIRQVTQIAQRVTQENNFNLQATVTTQDEIETLAQSLNQLIQWAGQYTHELEVAGETLEQRVRERTQELEQTLKELKTTQAQLIQTEKMSSLGQMVAGIAHEINNPINFIHGNITYIHQYVQDLLDLIALYESEGLSTDAITEKIEDIDLDFIIPDLEKILHSIRLGTERVKEIVVSLRNYSRLDEATVKAVDLHEGLNSTLLILNHRLKNHVEVVKDYDQLPTVHCSPAQLNQVFTNIIANAVDAMEEAQSQTRQIIITTQNLAQNKQVQIRIKDTGPGIPSHVQGKIFDPFFTTKPIGKGTGLGLGICFQIIENHQGKIEVISAPDLGTEFIITLPICGVIKALAS